MPTAGTYRCQWLRQASSLRWGQPEQRVGPAHFGLRLPTQSLALWALQARVALAELSGGGGYW